MHVTVKTIANTSKYSADQFMSLEWYRAFILMVNEMFFHNEKPKVLLVGVKRTRQRSDSSLLQLIIHTQRREEH